MRMFSYAVYFLVIIYQSSLQVFRTAIAMSFSNTLGSLGMFLLWRFCIVVVNFLRLRIAW